MVLFWSLYFFSACLLVLSATANHIVNDAFKATVYFLFVVTLILFSGFRAVGVDVDSSNYLGWYDDIYTTSELHSYLIKDPAFYISSKFAQYFGFGIPFVFFIYATTSLASKFLIFRNYLGLNLMGVALYLYFARFYFIHDMTQIRSGAAIGLATLALIMFFHKARISSILIYILSISFHFSVVAMLPFFLLILFNYRFTSRLLPVTFFCLLSLCAIYFNSNLDLLVFFDLDRVSDYTTGSYSTEPVRLFTFYFILKLLLLLYLIVFVWRMLSQFSQLIVCVVSFALFLQVFLANNDALALRINEVFSIFDILLFLVPLRDNTQSPIVARCYNLFLFAVGLVFFNSSLSLMQPYYTFF